MNPAFMILGNTKIPLACAANSLAVGVLAEEAVQGCGDVPIDLGRRGGLAGRGVRHGQGEQRREEHEYEPSRRHPNRACG